MPPFRSITGGKIPICAREIDSLQRLRPHGDSTEPLSRKIFMGVYALIYTPIMGNLLGLTPLQSKVWSLRGAKGVSVSETAKKLDTFKQNVHQTFLMAKSTVSNALLEVAEANRLEVRKVDAERGILWGYQ